MGDFDYTARRGDINYTHFAGPEFDEWVVVKTEGDPTRVLQEYQARRTRVHKRWTVINSGHRIPIKPDSRIFNHVVRAVEEFEGER